MRRSGLHHVALRVTDFERSLRFYTAGLGLRVALQFVEDGERVAWLDTGDGTYLELFSGGTGTQPPGALLHVALRTDDCDAAIARAREAGAPVTIPPASATLDSDPPVTVRYAFCTGPDGEEIEFLQTDRL